MAESSFDKLYYDKWTHKTVIDEQKSKQIWFCALH